MEKKKKREIWPIGIVFAMLTFMGGVIFAVTIMMRQPVPMTAEDYYAKEMVFQDQIDQASRALAPEEKPDIKLLRATEAIEITFPGKETASLFEGKLTFFRPSDPTKDFTKPLDLDENGLHWMSLRGQEKGLWMLKLEWNKDEVPYYYEQQIML